MDAILSKVILLALTLLLAASVMYARSELVVQRLAAAHAILEPIGRVGQ